MSTPRINPNDPKWTAYVLGELDEADCASVERLLEASAEARALVSELKVAASALDDAIASDSPELLTAAQRAAVRDAAEAGRARWFAHVPPRLPTRWGWGLGAAAAAIIVAAVVPMQMGQRAPAERSVSLAASNRTDALQPIDPQVTSSTVKSPASPADRPDVATAAARTFVVPAPSGALAAPPLSGALGESSIDSPTLNLLPGAL